MKESKKDMVIGILKMGAIPDSDSELQSLIDRFYSIICVDRTLQFEYTDSIPIHPELETTGPGEFDITELGSWLHPGQEDGGVVAGNEIYEELLKKGLINYCLNFADLMAIKSRGSRFFRRYFAGKELPAWKSVFLKHRERYVDLLADSGNGVIIKSNFLFVKFGSTRPAFFHKT